MKQYNISKDSLIVGVEKLKKRFMSQDDEFSDGYHYALKLLVSLLDTLEVKEVNEVPATVMVNKYGNRFISSWPGLKEYDNFKEGQEIKIVIPKK